MAKEDTLQDFGFEDWIPLKTQEMIRKFWDWHDAADGWKRDQVEQGMSELPHHGPNPNGFQLPPHGATCEYFIQDWEIKQHSGKEVFFIVKGRYVHRWNNMGSLIDENGKDWTVSTCDRWVRCFASDEERDRVLSKLDANSTPQPDLDDELRDYNQYLLWQVVDLLRSLKLIDNLTPMQRKLVESKANLMAATIRQDFTTHTEKAVSAAVTDAAHHIRYLSGEGYFWVNKLPNGDTEFIPIKEYLEATTPKGGEDE